MDARKVTNTVASAGIILTVSTTLSRILGLIRGIVINAVFGQSSGVVGAFNQAFTIPDLIFSVLASGAVSAAFIPVFTELHSSGKERDAWKLMSSLANLMMVVISVLVVVLFYFTPQIAGILLHGKSEQLDSVVAMSRILLPAQIAFMVGGVLQGALYAQKRFLVPSLAPNIYNICIILGAAFFTRYFSPGAAAMCWGALIGSWIGAFALPMMEVYKTGGSWRPRIYWKDESFRRVLKLMVPVLLGLSITSYLTVLLRYFAAFYGLPQVAALLSANELFQAPLGMFGQSLGLAAFPMLSEHWAKKDITLFRSQANKTMRQAIFLSFPFCAFFIAIPLPIIQAVYQHGNFTLLDSQRVAEPLRLFAIGIPFWCITPILTRAFYATQETKTPIIISSVSTVLFCALCFVANSLKLGFSAIALSCTLTGIVLAVWQAVALGKRVTRIFEGEMVATILFSLLGSLQVAVYSWTGLLVCEWLGWLNHPILRIVCVGFVCLCCAWIYYFFARDAGMPEADSIRRAMLRRSSKKPSAS